MQDVLSDILHTHKRKENENGTGNRCKKEIDNLGRLVIPKEMRSLFCLQNEVELVVLKEGILIRNPQYKLVKRAKNEN